MYDLNKLFVMQDEEEVMDGGPGCPHSEHVEENMQVLPVLRICRYCSLTNC